MFLKIRQNEFFGNILTLMGGTTIAQIIPIALQPVLRRTFEPELFGIYSLYLSYVAIVVVISTLKWDMAIVIHKEDRKAINIAALALLSSFVVNTLLLLLTIIFYQSLIIFLKFPETYGWWIFFVPLSAWLFSSYQVLNYWLIRKKAFIKSSTNKIVRRLTEGTVQIGFGFASYGPGLLIGDILGHIANVVVGGYQSIKTGFSLKKISVSEITQSAKEQSEFPKYQAFPALLTTFSISLPVIIVNKYFGVLETSYFDLSRMVLLVPTTLIAAALSQVLFQNISERVNNKLPILGTILKSSGGLAIISLLIVAVMFLAGPFLFALVFDDTYRISGEYSKVLSIAFMFPFIVAPISITLTALKKLKTLAAWQIAYFLIMITLLFVGFDSVEYFFMVFAAVNLVAYSIYWMLSIRVAMQYDRGLSKE